MKKISGYTFNEKEYEYSINSYSFLNILSLAVSHVIMWAYAVIIIFSLNFIVALSNRSIPKDRLFKEDAFDVVIPTLLFFFVYYLIMLIFSRDDDYKLRKNATSKFKHIIAAFWLLFGPLYTYKMYKKGR